MSRTHYAKDTTPGATGKIRAACGAWTTSITSNPAQVTCRRCKAINKTASKTMPRTTLTSTLLSFFVLAACGDVDPSDYNSDTTGEPATSIAHPDDTGAEDGFSSTSSASTSGDSSSGSESSSSTGDVATDNSATNATDNTETGDAPPGTCYGAPCDAVSCSPGMACVVNPKTGSPLCVLPCTTGICNDVAGCGVQMPEIECLPVAVVIAGANSFCFPITCEIDDDCTNGSCIDGTCF